MAPPDLAALSGLIRDIPDFPGPGVLFRDITPLLADGHAFAVAVGALAERVDALGRGGGGGIDKVAGVEARGFVLGGAVATALGVGFLPVRKSGKLPWRTTSVAYDLEYGTDALELHVDAAGPGQRVVVIDDVLATGGTAAAAAALVGSTGAEVAGLVFLLELSALGGRSRLEGRAVESLLRY